MIIFSANQGDIIRTNFSPLAKSGNDSPMDLRSIIDDLDQQNDLNDLTNYETRLVFMYFMTITNEFQSRKLPAFYYRGRLFKINKDQFE